MRGRTEAGQLGDVEAAERLHRGGGVGRGHEAQADAPDVVRVGQVRVPLPLHVQRAAQPRPAAAEPRLGDDVGRLEEEGRRSRLVRVRVRVVGSGLGL